MPLKPGKSQKIISGNISEFHKGPTYAKTSSKFGKARADKQAVAVALDESRRTGKGHSDAHEQEEVELLDKMKSMHKDVGKGQSKKVGCGHASCGVGKGCSYGKGQGKKVGKGQGAVPPPGGAPPARKPKGAMPLAGAGLKM